jgi:uncharacterized protein YndB with AHSA1/START domain
MKANKALIASVTVKRRLEAQRQRVWEAWTSAEALMAWFTTPDWPIVGAEADPRPGGRYVLRWVSGADGKPVHCQGVYREVVEPERLVFTWTSSHAPGMSETVVTVVLREVDGGTELSLTHEGFDTEKLRKEHDEGWAEMVDCLAEHLH